MWKQNPNPNEKGASWMTQFQYDLNRWPVWTVKVSYISHYILWSHYYYSLLHDWLIQTLWCEPRIYKLWSLGSIQLVTRFCEGREFLLDHAVSNYLCTILVSFVRYVQIWVDLTERVWPARSLNIAVSL